MANREHLAKLKEGVDAWNRWRMENSRVLPRLTQSDLAEMDLCNANLKWTDLRGACLLGARLRQADLRNANLGGADLRGATLYEANLSRAHLVTATLRLTDLVRANLTGADLTKANLTMARVGFTTFVDVNLVGAKGLETLKHIGPSIIDVNTLYKFNGVTPDVFLRGSGVPEEFIEYMASLAGSASEFFSLFISYSTKDQVFAERLHADLQDKGVRCWFAPHDVRGGKKLHEQIDEAIRLHDKLLLILSPASMDSEWVKTEISKARKREVKEGRRVLFPIRLCTFETLRDWECFDADTGKDSAREIREYFIPDFSHWEERDPYWKAFDRLLNDLQGSPEPTSALSKVGGRLAA